MPDTETEIFELVKPEDGGSSGTWGGKYHDSLDSLDDILARPRVQRAAPAVGAATTIDVADATVQAFTVDENTTVALTGWVVDTTPGKWAQRVLLQITNGGAFTVTWPAEVTWLSGVVPTLQASGVDYVELFTVDNGVTVYGVHYGVVDAIRDGSIVAADLADSAVETAKLEDDAVTAAKVADKERCKTAKSGTQAISEDTDTAITWDAADSYDSAALHDPASNNTRLTVPAGGWANSEAQIIAQITFAALNSSKFFSVWIRKNGTTELARVSMDQDNAAGAKPVMQVVAYDDAPAAADYYEVMVFTSEADTVQVTGSWATLRRLW